MESINDALYGFSLTWNSSSVTTTTVTISVHDNGNTGFDSAPGPNSKRSVEADLSDAQQFYLSAVNPFFPVPAAKVFDANSTNFNGVILLVNGWISGSLMQTIGVPVQIQVNRPDLLDSKVMLRLWCGNDGLLTLNVTNTPGLTLETWPSQLRLSGTVSALQSILYGLNYQPKGLFCGSDKIFVEMNDVEGHPLMSNAIEVTVLCIASPPELLVNNTTGDEDQPLKLTSLQVNPSNPGQVISVELYNVPEGFKVAPAHYDASRKKWNLQLKNVATPNDKIVSWINLLLQHLTRIQVINPNVIIPDLNPKFRLDWIWDSTPRVIPPPNFNGQITINITAIGQQKGIPSDVMTSKLVTLTFAPVNDAPSIFTPLHLFVTENLDTPVNKITIAPPYTQNSIQFSDLDLTPAQYSDPSFIFTLRFKPGLINGPWWTYVLLMDTASGTWTVGDQPDVVYDGKSHVLFVQFNIT